MKSLATVWIAAAAALSQNVSVAPWKDGAAGAYTLTLDDYCENIARGIHLHADSMLHNRGLVMGFATIVGSCTDESHWQIAARMIRNGHEFLNHSWTHSCGKQESWCDRPYWDLPQFPLEIDSATRVAERKLGIRVRFFVFPFDLWEPSKLNHLRSMGYLGARSGSVKDVNPSDFQDPFALAFDARQPPQNDTMQKFGLDAFVDRAIERGGWALREAHGVADDSWGVMTLEEFRAHLDQVKSKVDAGLLWVAGPSAVLIYQKQKLSTRPVVAAGDRLLIVHWDNPGLDTAVYNGELTFRIGLPPGFPAGFGVYQNMQKLPHRMLDASTLLVNARPHRGFLHVTDNPSSLRPGRNADGRFRLLPDRVEARLRLDTGPFRLESFTPRGQARVLARGHSPGETRVFSLPRAALEPGVQILGLTQNGRRQLFLLTRML